VKNPEKAAKIIACSFYKDLRRAGFETKLVLANLVAARSVNPSRLWQKAGLIFLIPKTKH